MNATKKKVAAHMEKKTSHHQSIMNVWVVFYILLTLDILPVAPVGSADLGLIQVFSKYTNTDSQVKAHKFLRCNLDINKVNVLSLINSKF